MSNVLREPTGPGPYFARLAEHAWDGEGERWHPVRVDDEGCGDDVWVAGDSTGWRIRDFDRWVPLVPPGGEA